MEAFLRDGVDFQALAGKTFTGDANLFEEVVPPVKIKGFLDSNQVKNIFILFNVFYFYFIFLLILK